MRAKQVRRTLRGAVIMGLAASLWACGAGGQVTIPVRACVLSETELASASESDRNDAVVGLFSEANKIWSQAAISFLACCQDIPVITDPVRSPDMPGVIERGIQESEEMKTARDACAAAWAGKVALTTGTGFTDGPIVIFVRDIFGPNKTTIVDRGITVIAFPGKLCVAPRSLNASDVQDAYVFLLEPASLRPSLKEGDPVHLLAHELGHTLLLFHGDGEDNDHDGLEPPNPGQRLFDAKCDSTEPRSDDDPGSLMNEAGHTSTELKPLQIELAREAAQVWPGRVGP